MARRAGIAAIALIAVLGTAGLAFAACSQRPDPAETRDALTEAAIEEDSADAEPSEYDIAAFPDPIVEPIECTPYLVLTSRGTGEPPRGQLLSPIARAIEAARPGEVAIVDVDYPADSEVNTGATRGVRWVLDTLRVQAEACPLQKFVLLGYSQGALVIGDALTDPEQRFVGSEAGQLDEAAVERIRAVVFYGNPRFVGSEPFDDGTYLPSVDGILPRPVGVLDRFADRIRDYCEAEDFICQASYDIDEQGHVAYYDNGMQLDGAAFVIVRLDPVADSDAKSGRGSARDSGTDDSDD